jgi:hypothetical protein
VKEFLVRATVVQHLETNVQANSLEEAERIADRELLTEDFHLISTEFTVEEVFLIGEEA